MGFLESIFGSKKDNAKEEKKQVPWIALTSLGQLDDIERDSASRPQLIFKHSTTCGVSRMVLNMFEKNPLLREDSMDLYFLDLHRHRGVSNEIAQKFQVSHQSPQLLVIKNGQTVVHGSHGMITEMGLGEYL
jgi:bacillithiol system protein YtxJ